MHFGEGRGLSARAQAEARATSQGDRKIIGEAGLFERRTRDIKCISCALDYAVERCTLLGELTYSSQAGPGRPKTISREMIREFVVVGCLLLWNSCSCFQISNSLLLRGMPRKCGMNSGLFLEAGKGFGVNHVFSQRKMFAMSMSGLGVEDIKKMSIREIKVCYREF
jgi:hypothetical protein